MTRRLLVLAALAGFVLAPALASAGTFVPQKSTFTFKLGGLPPLTVTGIGGNATVVNNGVGHDLQESASIWSTANIGVGTSFLTGVNLISNIKMTVHNGAGNFYSSFTFNNVWNINNTPIHEMGGYESLSGQIIISLGNPPTSPGLGMIAAPLGNVGGPGGTSMLPVPPIGSFTNTFGPFFTSKITMTNVTTNQISIPQRGGATGNAFTLMPTPNETTNTLGVDNVTTVCISGTNSLNSASQPGMITLVSPLRVNTGGLSGTLPSAVIKKFVFIPEPGTLLLLVSGAAGLVLVGRNRMRK